MHYLDITKDTPEKDVIKKGECDRECKHCQHFCNVGSGFLAEKDFAGIAKHLGVSEAKLKMEYLESVKVYNKTMWRPKLLREGDKPYGRCVFFNKHEKCTIHGVKPTQCKTSTCKPHGEQLTEWFYLNHVIDAQDPVAVREWAQSLKIKKTIPGGELKHLVEHEKLKKMLNYEYLSKEQVP